MIFNALNILFFWLVFTGIGLLFPWAVFARERRFEALLVCFWLGWAVAIAVLQLWHFFWPVDLAAQLALFALSAAGWLRARRAVGEALRGWANLRGLALAGLALIPAGMVANHVLFNAPNSDYALYHLQTVKWISNFAIVPGLGNLFNPLALNGSSFLYTAALDAGWLEGRAYFISNTLLSYAALLHGAAGFYGLLHDPQARNSRLFNALMIPVIMLQVSTYHLAAYSPDPIVFFLQIIIASEVLRAFEDPLDFDHYRRRAAQVALLAGAGISLKLSFAVFGLLSLLVVAGVGLARYQPWPSRDLRQWLRPALLVAGLLAVFLLPWMARSVMLSGYLAFPSTLVSLPVDWRIPAAFANQTQRVIFLWAATVDASINYTGDLVWFGLWWRAFPFFARQAFLITLLLAALNLGLWLALRKQARPDPAALALVLVGLVSLVFWFRMAPSYRHSAAVIWILLAANLLFGLRLLSAPRAGGAPGWLARPDLAAVALVLVVALWQSPNHFSNNLSRAMLLLPPSEQALAEQALPRASIQERLTNSGDQVYTPPNEVEECWDAPLPCTTPANFLARLRYRTPGSLQAGFTIDER